MDMKVVQEPKDLPAIKNFGLRNLKKILNVIKKIKKNFIKWIGTIL